MTNLAHAAGWYPDPSDPTAQRWWDGAQWTDHVQPASAGAVQPGMAAAAHMQGGFQARPATSGMAIAALVCAFVVPIVGFFLGIASLVGIKRSQGTATPKSGNGMAIAAIAVSTVWGVLVGVILLAVAIPVFLSQKGTATATLAKANVAQVRNAVESCATQNTNGDYAGCDAKGIVKLEPSIAEALARGCSASSGACVELTDDKLGYEVAATSTGPASTRITFTETHGADGTMTRTCAPVSEGTCSGTW